MTATPQLRLPYMASAALRRSRGGQVASSLAAAASAPFPSPVRAPVAPSCPDVRIPKGARSFTTTPSRRDKNFAAATDVDTSSPISRYDGLVQKGLLREDSYQRKIVGKLEALHDELKGYTQKLQQEPRSASHESGGFLSRLFGQKHPTVNEQHSIAIPSNIPKGLYLYGDVGTGKSMLMDLFYDSLSPNITKKRRVHFHQFMIDAHKRMHAFKALTHRPSGMVMSARSAAFNAVGAGGAAGGGRERARLGKDVPQGEEVDPIPHVAREFAEEATVLCFDEFQVTDIADAMILRRLFEHMLGHGVVCVATSNRHPDQLYKNGIQRSSFVPCIELLKTQLDVTDLDSGTDYRKLPRALTKVYFSPLTQENRNEMDKLWEALTSEEEVVTNRPLTIWGRTLPVPLSTTRVARFSFMDLCGRPRSAADYIEICRSFGTIFIDEIPEMGLHQKDLARRFITFVDAAYESKVRLFASSEVEMMKIFSKGEKKEQDGPTPDQLRALMDDLGLTMDQMGGLPLATGEEEIFAFARVLSRLSEMSSKQYAELSGGQHEAPPEY